jgi:hypothetical protein
MNITGNKKKIAIIGKGTAGSLNLSSLYHFNNHSYEIEWHYDPNTPSQSVGEGSTIPLPQTLSQNHFFSYQDFPLLDATLKLGIRKINWKGTNDYMHTFPISSVAMHFNSVKLQQYIYEKHKNVINIIPNDVKSYQDLDADYIIDCSGTPKDFSQHHIIDTIPVNTAYIKQCPWDGPKFDYTLTIARPYGWVFGIPLQNRCSIGYLFNSKINSFEEIKEDIKQIFKDFHLNPSEEETKISFKNYYSKNNFTNRVFKNGNASFFLEPMEANATGIISTTYNTIQKIIDQIYTPDQANFEYMDYIQQVESMICLHYYAGSKFKTPFWDNAQKVSQKPVERMFKDPRFSKILDSIRGNYFIPYDIEYGQWNRQSFLENLKNLDLI